MSNDNYEITFKRPDNTKRIPLYKLTGEELLQRYEDAIKSCHCFSSEISNPDAILNPYRDEISRRMGV